MEHWEITVTGDVQGVFYRATAQKKAEKLGLTGYAVNKNDGTVFIEAEGPPDKLEAFASWSGEGSDAAQVENIEIKKSKETKGFSAFTIM